jgi:hypothetical protein
MRKTLGITLFVAVVAGLVAALTFGVIQSNTLVIVLAAIPLGLVVLWFIARGYYDGACHTDEAVNIAAGLFGIPSAVLFLILFIMPSRSNEDAITMACFGFVSLAVVIYYIWACVLRPLGAGCISCMNDSWIVGCSLDSSYVSHRIVALSSIKEQSRLADIALSSDYQDDIRLMTAEQLENQELVQELYQDLAWRGYGNMEALELLRDQRLIREIADMTICEEWIRIRAAERVTDEEFAQKIYLEMAIQKGSYKALEHLQNPDLIKQVAKSASSEGVRATACLKTGGHFLDSECHCPVCGCELHDWQTPSTDEAEKNKSRANDPDDKLLFICTRCHALNFRGNREVRTCRRTSEQEALAYGVSYYDLGSWLCTEDSCEGCEAISIESYDYYVS